MTAREATDAAGRLAVADPATLLFCEAFTHFDRPLRRKLRARGTSAADADDIAQQAWEYVWKHHARWNDLQHIQRVLWLRAHSRAVDLLRAPDTSRVQLHAEFPEDALGLAPDTADVAIDRAWCSTVLAQIRALPASDRDLLLGLVDGHSYEQLAAVFDTTAGALRTKAHRARQLVNAKALLGAAGALLSMLTWLPRTARKAISGLAPSASYAARVMMATAVWVAAPVTTAPVVVRPEITALEAPSRPGSAVVTSPPASPESDDGALTAPAESLGVLPTPGPGEQTCVAGGAVCVGRDDPSASPSASTSLADGQWACVPAADHRCVSQNVVESCPYVNTAPEQVVYCKAQGTPGVQPPPPPGSSPSPQPSSSPDNHPSPPPKGPGS